MKDEPTVTVVLEPNKHSIVKKPSKRLAFVKFDVPLRGATFSGNGAVLYSNGSAKSNALEITFSKKANELIHTNRMKYYEELRKAGVVQPTHMGSFVHITMRYKVKRRSFLPYAISTMKKNVEQARLDVATAKAAIIQAKKRLKLKKRLLKQLTTEVEQ